MDWSEKATKQVDTPRRPGRLWGNLGGSGFESRREVEGTRKSERRRFWGQDCCMRKE